MSMFQLLYQVIRVISAIFLKAWREMGQRLQTTKSRELCFFQAESMYTFEKMHILDIFGHWPRGLVGLEVWGLPFLGRKPWMRLKTMLSLWCHLDPKKSLVFH